MFFADNTRRHESLLHHSSSNLHQHLWPFVTIVMPTFGEEFHGPSSPRLMSLHSSISACIPAGWNAGLPAGSLTWADALSRYNDVLVYIRHNPPQLTSGRLVKSRLMNQCLFR